MYTQFFQFKQAPFSIAPDPRYLFMSERHREALAHLLYGINSGGGFVLLTGEIGAGKTTVCRCLLEQIPEHCNVAYIFNPKLSVNELLQSICEEFRLDRIGHGNAEISAKHYVDALNAYLLKSHADGKNNVLIIDEAQNLAADVLEQLRLLTNLETSERKLLQVILIGQPELRAILARPELEQLAQRVIARYHLGALSQQETAGYIQYRLAIAATTATSATPFPAALMPKIHRLTRGVPRRINLLCDRALLGAYAASRSEVTPAIVEQAAHEVFGSASASLQTRELHRRWQVFTASALAGAVIAGSLTWTINHYAGAQPDAALQAALAAHPGLFKLSHDLSGNPSSWRQVPLSSAAVPMRMRTSAPKTVENQHKAGSRLPASNASIKPAGDFPGLLSEALRDEATAYRLLGQLWGIAIKQGNACELTQARNVYCYRSSNGLAELRRLNRPAILMLRDHSNTPYYAVLTRLTSSAAVLRLAGAAHDVEISLAELSRHFRGEFITFWRAPPAYSKQIALGDQGEAVDWLAAQLVKLQDGIALPTGQPFGNAMATQLRAFQQAQGVPADGIAGPQTLMLLNGAVGIHEPRLYPAQTVAAVVPGK
jgi:general secretion pathway protein A